MTVSVLLAEREEGGIGRGQLGGKRALPRQARLYRMQAVARQPEFRSVNPNSVQHYTSLEPTLHCSTIHGQRAVVYYTTLGYMYTTLHHITCTRYVDYTTLPCTAIRYTTLQYSALL